MSAIRKIVTIFRLILLATIGWIFYSRFFAKHSHRIGTAIDAERHDLQGKHSCFLSYYYHHHDSGRPLLLLHSINAAASAYEVRPLFEHYRGKRPVYALDLPGFGLSERSDREYSVELYVNAIQDMLDVIDEPTDVIALSLTSEFVARLSLQDTRIRSIALISPTGLGSFEPVNDTHQVETFGNATALKWLSFPLWSQSLFDLLASKISIRYFLKKSFEGTVDPNLIEYCWRSAHQPGARYAPFAFITGQLFTRNVSTRIYAELNVPALILYDQDPNVSFKAIPDLIGRNQHWQARRIPNTKGLPHFEKLDQVVEALQSFYQSIEQPTKSA